MPDNSAPYEIIAGPMTLWLATVATAFPDPNDTPSGSWVQVGTSGADNYAEDGVKVRHNQTLEYFRALGRTGPLKATRTEEDLFISILLADVSLEQYALALNHNTVSETNAKKIGLSMGLFVTRKALLARGLSPYGDGLHLQYEVPIVVQAASPEVIYQKSIGKPAMLALEFRALEDPAATTDAERFGRILADDGAT